MLAYVCTHCQLEQLLHEYNIFCSKISVYSGTSHKGHLPNKDTTARSQVNEDHTFHPLKRGHLCNQDTFVGPNSVLIREVDSTNHVHVCTCTCIYTNAEGTDTCNS